MASSSFLSSRIPSLASWLLLFLLLAPSSLIPSSLASAPLEPPEGKAFLAMWLDLDPQAGNDSPVKAIKRTNLSFPVYQFAFDLPSSLKPANQPENVTALSLVQDTKTNAGVYISLYPNQGFDKVDDNAIQSVVKMVEEFNKNNISVWIRYAPEMNGNWDPYAQRPTEFLASWKKLYTALHGSPSSNSTNSTSPSSNSTTPIFAVTNSTTPTNSTTSTNSTSTPSIRNPNVALVWSPNMGFSAVLNLTDKNSPNWKALDTNNDGKLDSNDDFYSPYWPGDEYVDWVGLSVYSFGYSGADLDNAHTAPGYVENTINNKTQPFYDTYAKGKGKPMMISESGAPWNPDFPDKHEGNITELERKQEFWRQYMTNETFTEKFPLVKFYCQFEFSKREDVPPTPRVRDFRITNKTEILNALINDLFNKQGSSGGNNTKGDRFIWAQPNSTDFIANFGGNGTNSSSSSNGTSGNGTGTGTGVGTSSGNYSSGTGGSVPSVKPSGGLFGAASSVRAGMWVGFVVTGVVMGLL